MIGNVKVLYASTQGKEVHRKENRAEDGSVRNSIGETGGRGEEMVYAN